MATFDRFGVWPRRAAMAIDDAILKTMKAEPLDAVARRVRDGDILL